MTNGNLAHQVRLYSGLVLFIFALTHFINHAFGLISVEATMAVQEWRTLVWRNPVGGVVLFGVLSAHILLALYAIYQRYTLKMPMWEAARLLMGLAIPFFMLGHIMNTRFAHEVLGVQDTYVYEFVKLWPNSAVDQTVLLLLVWIHSCIGLHYWLRLKNWYRRTTSLWFTLAILIPTLSLLGFYAGGQLMERLEADAAWLAQLKIDTNWPDAAEAALIGDAKAIARTIFFVMVAIALSGRPLRSFIQSRSGQITITYADGRVVRSRPGPSLLEISRANGIPHASVCGGAADARPAAFELPTASDSWTSRPRRNGSCWTRSMRRRPFGWLASAGRTATCAFNDSCRKPQARKRFSNRSMRSTTASI